VAQVIGASGVPVADLVAAAAVLSRLASESNLPTVDGASPASDGDGGYAAAGSSEERTSWAVAAQFCDDAGHLGSRLARYLERIGHPVPDAEPR
jgi:antitoxin (DNA-binding transcriptional repressor) of toxin-antitoxin stability system